MKTPGFTAEASLYKSESYRSIGNLDAWSRTQSVIPQQAINVGVEEGGATAVRHCIKRCWPSSWCETVCHTLYY
jgi:hypothetical protein